MSKKDILNNLEYLNEQLKKIERQERSDDFLKLLWSVLLDEKSKIILTGHEERQFTERYLVKDISVEYRVELAKFLKTLMKKELEMTSKEALNLFKQYHWSAKDKEKALEILEEIVERDTPKKPLFVELNSENKHHYVCPICNSIVNIGNSIGYNMMFNVFCKKYGQRLDWSE